MVCGLEVHVDATADSNGGGIVIEPGYAIDCCGEEIAVPARVQLALPPDGEAAFVSLRRWDNSWTQLLSQPDIFDVGWTEEACLIRGAPRVTPKCRTALRRT